MNGQNREGTDFIPLFYSVRYGKSDPTRVGRDAGRSADEVISHLEGLVGSKAKVTMEIEAEIPSGTPDNVVRTVTENSRTLEVHQLGL